MAESRLPKPNSKNQAILDKISRLIKTDLTQAKDKDDDFWDSSNVYILNGQGEVETLDLWDSDLDDISFLKDLTSLKELSLSTTQFVDISVLKKLKKLTQLELVNIPISDITDFKDLPNLTQLNLVANQINDISDLKNLPNLKGLVLASNEISDISVLKELTSLTQLNLSDTDTNDISLLRGMINLTELSVSCNKISDISVLEELVNLTELNLSDNEISDISVLKELKNLTELDLPRNKISDISVLEELVNLTELNLSDNEISDISVLKELKNLTELDLPRNKISDISVLKELINLKELDLSCNKISDISILKELINLTQLNLSRNQIRDISALKEFINLTALSLLGNKINDISGLKDLINLVSLDLESTQISDISDLRGLVNLKRLYLAYNRINDIYCLKEIENLELLDLRYNVIRKIDATFFCTSMGICWRKIPIFDGCNLYDNPLEIPPVEIVKQGREAVLDYFKSVTSGGRRYLNELKVLLVGHGESGKTSLVKRIFDDSFDEQETQTPGIVIRNKNYRNQEGKTIKTHFWDFGGQQMYHSTHQFFLSRRSLYVLVLDGRKDEDAEYWLKHIESFGGNSSIMVVINKCDQNPNFDVNRKYLRDKYKGIKGFYKISCKSKEGVSAFKNKLREEVLNTTHLQDAWGGGWFKVKNKLEKMKDHYINVNEYADICNKAGVKTESEQDTLVDYLNDLGVVLHFKELNLMNMHVLEPLWVTEAVYRIINDKKLAEKNGRLEPDRLTTILRRRKNCTDDYKYPRETHQYIIELMKKFELCFDMGNDVLIPNLQDIQEPDIDLGYDSSLDFYFQYDFLPLSVIPRFTVKMHKYIDGALSWRTGVVLKRDDLKTRAVVKSDSEEKRIYVNIEGENKRDHLTIIWDTFRDIHSGFAKLEVEEMIACNCEYCKNVDTVNDEKNPHYFEYNQLKNRRRVSATHICGNTGKDVNIDEILGDYVKKKKDENGNIIYERCDFYSDRMNIARDIICHEQE